MAQAETVAIPKRLPLIIQPENRDETTTKDAKLVNAYVEKQKDTGESWLFKRPGLAQYGSTISGNGYGVFNWLGDIYSIFGSTLYKNGVALAGTINTANGVYRFAHDAGATPKLVFSNGVAPFSYNTASGILPIAGANYPSTTVKGWAYLDGTLYIGDTGNIVRGSTNIDDVDTWTDTLNRISAHIEPDANVFIWKQLVYVIIIKQWTTEVFYDASNPVNSPLSAVQGAKLNYGGASGDSVQELDGSLFWISTNRSASAQVIMVDNLKANIISTPAIDRLLGEADFSSVLSWAFKYEGHKFYGFTLKNNNITLVYDVVEKMWAQWTDTNGNYFPIISTTYHSVYGPILQHETNGKLYRVDSQYFTDDGDAITVDIYTPNFDGGVRRRKQMKMLEFIGDQTDGSVLQVRVYDSDYAADKWTNFRQVNMDVKKPILTDCGTFMRRAHHIRHQCNTRMRLQAIELQIDLGVL